MRIRVLCLNGSIFLNCAIIVAALILATIKVLKLTPAGLLGKWQHVVPISRLPNVSLASNALACMGNKHLSFFAVVDIGPTILLMVVRWGNRFGVGPGFKKTYHCRRQYNIGNVRCGPLK